MNDLLKHIEEWLKENVREVVREELERLVPKDLKNNEDEILNVKGAAAFVQLSISRVYTLVNTGQLPSLTPTGAGKLRFSKKALRAWMQSPNPAKKSAAEMTVGLKPPSRLRRTNMLNKK